MPTPLRPPVREAPVYSTRSAISVYPGEPSARAAGHSGALARWAVLFLALNVADGLETWLGLRLGIPERLPVYAWLFTHTSFALAMLYKAFVDVWAVAFLVHTRRRWPWLGFAALCMRLLCLETLLVVIANGVEVCLRLR